MALETPAGSTTTPVATQPEGSQALNQPAPVASPAPANNSTAPTKEVVPAGQAGRNWQEDYTKLDRSYQELRRKLVEQGTEKNEYNRRFQALESQHKAVLDAVRSMVNKQTYDPAKFQEELFQGGPDYLKKLHEESLNAAREELRAELHTRDEKIETLLMHNAVNSRRQDSEKYPDFKTLEPVMSALYNANDKFYDALGLEEKIDALYNQAVLQRSQDALKQAAELGQKKTDAELAREARATVAAGGKNNGAPLPDPKSLSLEQLREQVAKTVGVAER